MDDPCTPLLVSSPKMTGWFSTSLPNSDRDPPMHPHLWHGQFLQVGSKSVAEVPERGGIQRTIARSSQVPLHPVIGAGRSDGDPYVTEIFPSLSVTLPRRSGITLVNSLKPASSPGTLAKAP